jgi:hypothetical protein
MSQLELNRMADAERIGSDWKGLCWLGGVAALILLLYSVVTVLVLTLLGAAPSSAAESFTMLQNNRIVGLGCPLKFCKLRLANGVR